MNEIERAILEMRNHPDFCKKCNKVSESTHEVLENTSIGQRQGKFCLLCGELKRTRLVKYKNKQDYERIYEKQWDLKHFKTDFRR